MEWLTKGYLSFGVKASSITFLHTPTEFYETLKTRIRGSKHRILMTSLYLGSGELEAQLVRELTEAVEAHPQLQLSILLDYFRGTRGGKESSAGMLQPLADRAQIYFFHTPDMRAMTRWLLPERINELVGLQHMKFFIFDDSIIISGANLSDSYFTVRQDRYILIENSPALVDFFSSLFNVIASSSLRLNAAGDMCFDGVADLHPMTGNVHSFKQSVSKKLEELFSGNGLASTSGESVCDGSPADTFICPYVQMGTFRINQEVDLLTRLFRHEGDDLNITLSTAYFNFHEDYAAMLLSNRRYPLSIVYPSPRACGFFGAGGLSGQVPSYYVLSSLEFLKRSLSLEREAPIKLLEYERPGWTYHSKGIWLEMGKQGREKRRMATIVGSSNFGYRSTYRDLEAQMLLVTENDSLAQRIAEERNLMLEHCNPVDLSTFLRPGYEVPRWIRIFSGVFKRFF